jgi:gluconolactonase
VIRLETDGKETVLADRYQGKRFNAPDDVIARSDGNIYFSDPSFAVKPQEKELAFDGVYRISPDGTISVVSQTLAKPNGLAFAPDEKTLYVNDTVRQQIFAYDVAADGTPSHERLFAYVTGELPGQPNGLKVDRLGNVYCTGPGGIQIFSSVGKYIGYIYMATVVSNFCFGGKDFKTLYITSGSSVFQLKMNVAGVPPSSKLSSQK